MAVPSLDAILDTVRWILLITYFAVVVSYVYTANSETQFAKRLQNACDYPLEKDTVRARLYAQSSYLARLYTASLVLFAFILLTTIASWWQAWLASNADLPLFTKLKFSTILQAPLTGIIFLKDRSTITLVTILIILLQVQVVKINREIYNITSFYQQNSKIDRMKGYLSTFK